MKFCRKCNCNVLDYEADAVALNELQTNFAIVIRCTICNSLIQYKHINHEENRTSIVSTPAEHASIPIHVCESSISKIKV